MPIGERIITQYIPHPAVGSGWLANGAPLDSGSAMIAHSNLSHLSERNTRLIGHQIGPGDVTTTTSFTAPWAAAIDASWDSANTIAANPFGVIPWTVPDCAFNFGPIAMAFTRLGTAPAGFTPRRFRVVVQAYKSNEAGTFLGVMAAVVVGGGTPFLSDRIAEATVSPAYNDGAPGAKIVDLILSCDTPVRPTESWRSRPTSSGAAAQVMIAPAHVWVGWCSTTAGTPDRVESVSVFELRD